jgi:hypothetical protein
MITDFSDKYARSSITDTGDVLQLQHEECMIVDYYERYCTVCMIVDYNGKYVWSLTTGTVTVRQIWKEEWLTTNKGTVCMIVAYSEWSLTTGTGTVGSLTSWHLTGIMRKYWWTKNDITTMSQNVNDSVGRKWCRHMAPNDTLKTVM